MIAVTGANGYVGGRILAPPARARHRGDRARAPTRGMCTRPRGAMRSAEPLGEGTLEGVDTVVHAA